MDFEGLRFFACSCTRQPPSANHHKAWCLGVCLLCATEGKRGDPTDLTTAYPLHSCMSIMGDNDDEIARSRLSETSENDSVTSKENDSIAKASNLRFSSHSEPNIVKRSNVCQSPVFEVSSISTEPDSESLSEPDISQGIWVRKFVDQLDSSVSSEVSSAKEDSPSENEGSSSGSEGQISSIEEDLNFSINRYCNYEESEHHTGDLTDDSDYTAKPPGSSCVVSEEGRHATARFLGR